MSKRETFLNERRVLGVVMAAIMVMSMFAIAIASCTEKAYAREGIMVERVDITLDPVKCGTEVTLDEAPDVTQTPMPTAKVTSKGADLAKNLEFHYGSEVRLLFVNKKNPYPYDALIEDMFQGKISSDSEVWVKIPIFWEPDYEFDEGDWVEDTDYGNWFYETNTKAYVNGKETKIYWPSGCPYVIVKLDTTKLEHDWDAGKVSGDTKTYTCKSCGATKTEKVPSTASSPLFATMSSKGAKAMNFSWNKVAGAAGYEVYLSKCNHAGNKYTPKKVKTVKGNKTAKCTVKGLKKGIPYKGYVRAYKMVNGKKTYIGKSLTVHAFTNGGSKKYTNPKSVSVKKASVSLKAGKTYSIKASVKKLKARKALINTSHAPKLRYVSSNPKVATVSGSGKITAKSAGKCNVYAIAINGARKAVKVTVK